MKTTTRLYLILIVLFFGFASFLGLLEVNRMRNRTLLHDSFEKYEDRLFSHILKMNEEKISNPLKDNSTWDDMAIHCENPGTWFAEQSFENSLKTFSLNYLWVFNKNGEEVFSLESEEGLNKEKVLPPAEIKKLLTTTHPFCHYFEYRKGVLIEFFGSTVSTSEDIAHTKEPRGFLFFGKIWDQDFVNYLSGSSGSKVIIDSTDQVLSQGESPSTTLISYHLLNREGRTIGQILVKNEILSQSEFEKEFLMIIVLTGIISILAIILVGFFLNRWIAKPLKTITRALDESSERPIVGMSAKKHEFGKIASLIRSTFQLKNELRQEGERSRTSMERFRQIAEASSDFIWETDPDGKYTYCSDKIFDILGYRADEVVGKHYFYDFFAPERKEEYKAGALSMFASKLPFRNFQNENIRKDGQRVILETSGVPMLDEQGKLTGYRGTDRDVTLRTHVMLRLEENERILKEAKEKAEENSRLKSSLLMNMSHELRTPLNGILGFASLLKDKMKDGDEKAMTEVIYSSGKRLMATLNSIMELSQVEANQTVFSLEVADMGQTVTEFLSANRQMFERKNIQMSSLLEKEVFAKIDSRLFKSTLFHLLDNAVKYTEEGTVHVEVKKEQISGSKFMVLKVVDTGIGISETQMGYIFDAFRQGNEGIGRSHEGTGLGLTLARSFTRLMGGEILVESKVGVGSTFTVRLPLSEKKSAKATETVEEFTPPEVVQGKKKPRVLIVEDNEANSDLMSIYLSQYCVCDQTFNGIQAEKMAYLNDYQLILMDINLGKGKDGIETLKEIRRIDRYKKVPVIAVTGYSTQSEKTQIMSHGFDGFLTKPFERSELVAAVVKMLKI